ncbi:MAG: cupin domain-containing protein [Bacteroidota bacterium]
MKYVPNVDISRAFSTTVMVIDDQKGKANGLSMIEPGADGPPIHKHPSQEEIFRVLEGELQVYKKNQWTTLKAGEEIIIPKDTPHTFRSRNPDGCLFEYALTPKGNFTNMLKTFERMMADGKLVDNTSLKSKIYLSMVFMRHSSEIVSVSPPQFVIASLSKIGKLLGYSVD